ncbi:MAG: hypothetical protein ACEQR8_06155 [Cypionkella sp.]
MTRPAIAAAAALLALAGCAAGPAEPRDPRARTLVVRGEPSTVIAAELAFAREAREKGTWAAFRQWATADAIWPDPGWKNVQLSLKGVPDPARAVVWAPDMVWVSCDGSYALSTGPATWPDGSKNRFATIWQRQDNGDYRWVLDQGFDLEEGYAPREMIAGRAAECPPGTRAFREQPRPRARRGEAWHGGRSDDGTLAWTTALAADCRRTHVVSVREDGATKEVFRRTSSVPPVREGAAAPAC